MTSQELSEADENGTDWRGLLNAYGKTQRDLTELTGSRSRASEYLAGKRFPPIAALRAMRLKWGIPFDALFGIPPGTPRCRPLPKPPSPSLEEADR